MGRGGLEAVQGRVWEEEGWGDVNDNEGKGTGPTPPKCLESTRWLPIQHPAWNTLVSAMWGADMANKFGYQFGEQNLLTAKSPGKKQYKTTFPNFVPNFCSASCSALCSNRLDFLFPDFIFCSRPISSQDFVPTA